MLFQNIRMKMFQNRNIDTVGVMEFIPSKNRRGYVRTISIPEYNASEYIAEFLLYDENRLFSAILFLTYYGELI